MTTKTAYVEGKIKTLSWGHRGTCVVCGKETSSGTLIAIGYDYYEGVETDIECFVCVKRDIAAAWDTDYEYYSGGEGLE